MKGEAYVFCRPSGAKGFGHVGWGFLYESVNKIYCYGGTENIKSHPIVLPGGNNYAWIATGSFENMRTKMSLGHYVGYRYTVYKRKFIDTFYPQKAYRVGDSKKKAGYAVTGIPGNNCADHAYDILKAYGVTLPLLQLSPAPKKWFSKLNNWEEFVL